MTRGTGIGGIILSFLFSGLAGYLLYKTRVYIRVAAHGVREVYIAQEMDRRGFVVMDAKTAYERLMRQQGSVKTPQAEDDDVDEDGDGPVH